MIGNNTVVDPDDITNAKGVSIPNRLVTSRRLACVRHYEALLEEEIIGALSEYTTNSFTDLIEWRGIYSHESPPRQSLPLHRDVTSVCQRRSGRASLIDHPNNPHIT